MDQVKVIEIKKSVFADNEQDADNLRKEFRGWDGFCFGEGAGVFGRGDLWMKQVGDNTRNGIARVCPNITKTMTATVWVVYAKQVQLTRKLFFLLKN